MLLLSLVAPAFACGGFVPQEGFLAASDAQQAVFEVGADSVSVTYQARYSGNAADFAWVIAVPGTIDRVVAGASELLPALESASAPWVDVDPNVEDYSGSDGVCGCGAYNYKDKGGDFEGDTGVDVLSQGFVGDFEYTTLAAADADSLAIWLTDHGYDIARIESALADYVADPLNYEFVAVQLRPEAVLASGAATDLDPLQITYGPAADGALHVSFPAKLGASSTVELVRTELYVLASGKAELSGWAALENGEGTTAEPWDIVGSAKYNGEEVYAEKLKEIGTDQRQMWLAYSGAVTWAGTQRWLTRYDAIVVPEANTVDPVFADSGARTEADTVIYLMENGAYKNEYGALLLPLGLLGVAGWVRRRRVLLSWTGTRR